MKTRLVISLDQAITPPGIAPGKRIHPFGSRLPPPITAAKRWSLAALALRPGIAAG
jgi:hypothetical protein